MLNKRLNIYINVAYIIRSLDDKQVEKMALQLYQYGGYSPRYGEEAQAMPGIEILDEVEDRKRIDARREELKKGDEEQPGATVSRAFCNAENILKT